MPLTNGLVVMTPTSAVNATIRSDGSAFFNFVTSFSLNGVFNSSYDNYMISLRLSSAPDGLFYYRLRASGTDATGSDYSNEFISADGTTVGASNTGNVNAFRFSTSATGNGETLYMFGPNLAQATAVRSVSVDATNNTRIRDYASVHTLSSSYDGLTIFIPTGSMQGLVTVFGFNQ